MKRDHIRLITERQTVAQLWQAVVGRCTGTADIDAVYVVFIPKQLATLADYAEGAPAWAGRLVGCR